MNSGMVMRNERIDKKPTGAVMVVGGGIAGMQASLDLADQGFKVYLVEVQSAIGGKMAQLDKTFPTNDCAMCTISPRLVETGRHPNIEILTNTQVQDVKGSVGDFSVRMISEPRYVDPEKCVACGDCVKVCPVTLLDTFNEGLSKKRAVYKLYPQAVPNAYAIHKRGIAPCRDACPSGQRAQGYIALIREGRWDDAMRVIKMDNPFPGICGRICNHRCEAACNRGLVDEPVNIRALKRFVSDKVYSQERLPVERVDFTKDQQVAIIGAGPCGLTAAQDMVRAGYRVTVFEAMPVAGGMLRLGVPEYRLPTEIIEREVQDIVDLGVELRLNHRVDNLDDLFSEGFEAVLVAVGAHEGIRLPVPGANLDGVLVNTHFLRDVRLGVYQPGKIQEPLGRRVLVLGGGNVAIDCARSAVRLGCHVELACLEDRAGMPAHDWEIEAAEQEGVILHPGRSFEQIIGDGNGRVSGVECMRVESFRFDENGRLQVEKFPDSSHTILCDTVIFSVGQRAGLAFIPPDAGVGITPRQTIAINPNTLAATRPGVFAAGDSVSGTSFVIEAVDSGHKAAASIIRYLEGEDLEPKPKPELPVVHLAAAEIESKIQTGEIVHQGRVPLPEMTVEDRLDNFSEVEGGYDDSSAMSEAARCLACGVCSECMSCTFACGADAINHDMPPLERQVSVGAVILAPGYQTFKAEYAQEFGLGRYPNVITALQYERLLSASGPTFGHIKRPSDGGMPRRIAFLQCIGSRDKTHDYCSAVCCMYATKEAIMTKDHHPELEIDIFMMDMRAFSKGYWSYFDRARNRYGVKYHYSRISSLHEDAQDHSLTLQYQNQEGTSESKSFDLVVLSVGMEISDDVRQLGRRLGVELDEYGFCHTPHFNPLESTRAGIYAVGPFREPKDIPESVVEASGAAASVAGVLSESRFTLTKTVEFPPERDITTEPVKVGVFVCHCGSNIGGYLDVPDVTEYARKLPHVAHAENNLYTCSQDSIKHISETISELSLNRVVIASCTPLTHLPIFQDCLQSAGLNPYLVEMANIRNQCSWVHSGDRDAATNKARQLVRMAVARAAVLEPQYTLKIPMQHRALVVGGGPAGLTASLSLARQGFPVDLVEKTRQLGGGLRQVRTSLPGQDLPGQFARLLEEVSSEPLISVHLHSRVESTTGFLGNFTTRLCNTNGTEEIQHGVTVLATGGEEYRGPDFGYGSNANIITQQEFEAYLHNGFPQAQTMQSLAMILCVGPAEQYCSRICCTIALKNALAFKNQFPDSQVVIFYKDIRVYGFKERLYTEARRQGVVFIRYETENPPEIIQHDGQLTIQACDLPVKRLISFPVDKLVLSMPVVPSPQTKELAGMFKTSLDSNGFLLEAHVKLRPVDSATGGIFIAGSAHYPKLLDETIIQAQAAAARAGRILSRDTLEAGGRVAFVDPDKCTGCLTCVRVCPFQVPRIDPEQQGVGGVLGAAMIEASVCQGCGICAAECPARAIQLRHYTDVQMTAKVDALIQPVFIEELGV